MNTGAGCSFDAPSGSDTWMSIRIVPFANVTERSPITSSAGRPIGVTPNWCSPNHFRTSARPPPSQAATFACCSGVRLHAGAQSPKSAVAPASAQTTVKMLFSMPVVYHTPRVPAMPTRD